MEVINVELPRGIQRVGVFRNQQYQWINEVIDRCGLNIVQLHGDEPPDYLENIRVPCIKVLPVKKRLDADDLVWADSKALALLLDNAMGGSGKTFDWSLFHAYRRLNKPLLLAGGLSPDNIESAIDRLCPDGVDTSSGVEIKPGIKDHGKVERFIAAAKRGFAAVMAKGDALNVTG